MSTPVIFKGFHLLNESGPSDLMDLGYKLVPSPSNRYKAIISQCDHKDHHFTGECLMHVDNKSDSIISHDIG